MTADSPPPEPPQSIGAVIPIDHARRIRTPEPAAEHPRPADPPPPPAAHLRHDNPRWPVRSPTDAANALQLHGDCPWHCSTRIAAIIVSRDDYQYFRTRRHTESHSWTTPSDW